MVDVFYEDPWKPIVWKRKLKEAFLKCSELVERKNNCESYLYIMGIVCTAFLIEEGTPQYHHYGILVSDNSHWDFPATVENITIKRKSEYQATYELHFKLISHGQYPNYQAPPPKDQSVFVTLNFGSGKPTFGHISTRNKDKEVEEAQSLADTASTEAPSSQARTATTGNEIIDATTVDIETATSVPFSHSTISRLSPSRNPGSQPSRGPRRNR
jgi:hypothetical protein